MRFILVALQLSLYAIAAADPTSANAMNSTSSSFDSEDSDKGRRELLAVLEMRNMEREQKKLESIERAAAVAMCQASKGYDCWRYATAPSGGQVTHVKVFGERQSGSRFVRQLVALNLDVELVSLENETKGLDPDAVDYAYRNDFARSFGWKHSCAPSASQLEAVPHTRLESTLFLMVAKNPYAWLMSLYARLGRYRGSDTKQQTSTFEDFTRLPWTALPRENLISCQPPDKAGSRRVQRDRGDHGFLNPIVMWNQKHRSYRRLRAPYVFFARYEDVLVDPTLFLKELVTKFGLRRRTPYLVNVLQATSLTSSTRFDRNKQRYGTSTALQNRTFDSYRKHYLYGGWQAAFRSMGGESRLKFIHRWLDHDLLATWGYLPWDESFTSSLSLSPGTAGIGGGTLGSTPQVHSSSARSGGLLFSSSGSGGSTAEGSDGSQIVGGSLGTAHGSSSGVGMHAMRWRVREELGGRFKAAQDEVDRENLAAIGMPALLARTASTSADSSSSSTPKKPDDASTTAAAGAEVEGSVDKDARLCDGSDGPLKRRDRLRCARRNQRSAALQAMHHQVSVLQYSEGLVPRGQVGKEARDPKSKQNPLNAFVEQAAVSAVASAKG